MRKYIVFGFLAALSIAAHEFLPRHDSPLFVVGVMWFAWMSGLFHTYEGLRYTSRLPLATEVKHLLTQTPIVMIAIYMLFLHIAMQISYVTEYMMSVLFLVSLTCYEVRR